MINYMRLFSLLFFFLLSIGCYAQSEKEMVRKIAVLYKDGKIEEACQLSKDGIAKYPTSASLKKLNNLCCNATSPIQQGPEPKCEHGNILKDCAKCETVENPKCQHGNDSKTCASCNPHSVKGCMDEDAINYNPRATEDDESCNFNLNFKISHTNGEARITWDKSIQKYCSSISIKITGEYNPSIKHNEPNYSTSKGYFDFVPGEAKWHLTPVKVEIIAIGLNPKYQMSYNVLRNQAFKCSQ